MFGELSDDEDIENDQIEEIFKSFYVPKMLSPIKDFNESEGQQSDNSTPASVLCSADETPLTSDICTDVETQLPILELSTLEVSNSIAIQSTIENTSVDDPLVAFKETSHEKCENNSNELECDNASNEFVINSYSPASPRHEDQISTESPPIIPPNTLSNSHSANVEMFDEKTTETESIFDQIIHKYSAKIRGDIKSMTIVPEISEAEAYLLASLRNAIETYCVAKEWTSEALTCCVDKMFALSRRPKHLVTAVLEVIEDSCEKLSFEFTPPAPAMQPSHQKCLVLVKRIAQQIPSFDKYIEHELERGLFTFTQKLTIPAMINLAQFYIGLIDTEQPMNRSKVLLFIYKSLYYYTHKAMPLVFTMIMAHPFVLPHANAVEFIGDPLIRAIVSILTNIGYTVVKESDQIYKKTEMFIVLKRRFGYFALKSFPINDVVDYCIDCIHANRLENVDYALILLAKRQGAEWAMKQIIEKHLVPMLHQYVVGNSTSTTEHDQQIRVILFTIASIVKTLPDVDNVDAFLDIFMKCLTATERQTIQEAAALAICQMNRFGTTNIYRCLSEWRPNYEISTNVLATLNTIVYRKPKTFWFAENI